MGRHRLSTLVFATILFFSAVIVWEWVYSSQHGTQHAGWVISRAAPSGGNSRLQHQDNTPPTAIRVVKNPRKLITSLQTLVEAEEQLPIDAQAAAWQSSRTPGPNSTTQIADSHVERLGNVLENAAIILFCFNRVPYLNQTLSSLAELPGLRDVTLYISQDGNDTGVEALVSEVISTRLRPPVMKHVEHWKHAREPLLSEDQPGHAWLSQHYKWALTRLFEERNHSHAIILEDDMLFSHDFLLYFKATASLLEQDPTIWCISSWNDNGLSHLDWKNDRLFRTSYFPGLGWMIRQQLWNELSPQFPLQAWDHWMRLNSTSKGRECISPEVNRNKNIGERGANMQRTTFKRYLAHMSWSQDPVVDWGDLSYLHLQTYQQQLQNLLDQATVWDQPLRAQKIQNAEKGKVWLLPYKGEEYAKIARLFRIWPYPRAHHRHMSVLPYEGSTFLLTDQRFSPFLPDKLRVHPHPTLKATSGPSGVDCDTVCRNINMTCLVTDFWFINTCGELQAHFPCEKGCAIELGFDVPNYVTGPHLPTFQTCLVTQTEPKCSAAHPDTRRLCPCVVLEQ